MKTVIPYSNGGDILSDARAIIDGARQYAYSAVNEALVQRNWLLGKRIREEILNGDNRAEYGAEVIVKLAEGLKSEYGEGFTKTNLYSYLEFYKTFPEIFHAASGKFDIRLGWTHYRILLQVNDSKARAWYMNEAVSQTWSTRTLQRNIDSQYYYRILRSQNQESVRDEMFRKNAVNQMPDKFEFVKNPVVAEFLGLQPRSEFTENTLEGAIITNLQKFMMELGKGFAFVARQQHVHTEKQDYYIDLVFYNYILKCFCLIDLKTSKVTHQDVGQMDMYVRMYDELKRSESDNSTIGIILCSETDADIARYSVLHGNEQLFASKYKLYLPTEEELRAETESQKALFLTTSREKRQRNRIDTTRSGPPGHLQWCR